MNNIEYTLAAVTPGTSRRVDLVTPGTPVPSGAFPGGPDTLVVTPTMACFMAKGTTPSATGDGTDQYLVANNTYRIFGLRPGEQLSFNGPTAGAVFMTPGA